MRIEDPTAVTTVRHDWLGEEQALPGVWAELGRLLRRSRRRWPRALLYALLLSGLVVGAVAARPRSYASRVVFRVSDGALRDYLTNVVFSDAHLRAVIGEHQLYPALMAQDPNLAVAKMRDDLDVELSRSDLARPLLAITYHGPDAQAVYDTVTDLRRRITDAEQLARVMQVESAQQKADDLVESMRDLVETRKRELYEQQIATQRARTPEEGLRLLYEQRELEKGLPRVQKLLEQAQKRREEVYLRLQPGKQAHALHWEPIDRGHLEPEWLSRSALLVWLGALAFLLALPLACIGVAAFDPHVYDLDDVRRLGLPTVGVVRRFEGDNAGALVARLASDDAARSAPDGGRARMGRS